MTYKYITHCQVEIDKNGNTIFNHPTNHRPNMTIRAVKGLCVIPDQFVEIYYTSDYLINLATEGRQLKLQALGHKTYAVNLIRIKRDLLLGW